MFMKVRFQMWIDEDLKALLRRLGDRRGVSMARIIEQAVEVCLKEAGFIIEDDTKTRE